MTAATSHRLDGLEPDNLLAFLALLGLLRALEAADDALRPRAAWDLDQPPLRPRLFVASPASPDEIAVLAAKGIDRVVGHHDFGGRKEPKYTPQEARELLEREVPGASRNDRYRIDLLAALMCDAVVKKDANTKKDVVDPTPLCLLFGQGHQYFLERLAEVPRKPAPPPRGTGKKKISLSASECLAEALFAPWHREDDTKSFRWDPAEDVRYALMPGDPTDSRYKAGTQHGANRLAAVGLSVLALVPRRSGGRIRPAIVGGAADSGGFSFAIPIWREPATLLAICALLSHPDLRTPGKLAHLGVDHVFVTRRIPARKYWNFTRGQPVSEPTAGA